MRADTERVRPDKPFLMTNLRAGDGVDGVIEFLAEAGGLQV